MIIIEFIKCIFYVLLLMLTIGVTACLSWVVVLVIKYLKSLFEEIKSHNRDK